MRVKCTCKECKRKIDVEDKKKIKVGYEQDGLTIAVSEKCDCGGDLEPYAFCGMGELLTGIGGE